MTRRTAIVTGGGAGIGAATCLRLAREGLAVAVLGRSANVHTVAAAIAYFALEDASYVTGQVLGVSGCCCP